MDHLSHSTLTQWRSAHIVCERVCLKMSSQRQDEVYDAVLQDRADLLAKLVLEGVSPMDFCNEKRQTIFHITVNNSSLRCLDYLATLGPSREQINAQNKFGETILHLVASLGDLPQLRRILSLFGELLDMYCVDQWQRSPSDVAKEHGYLELIGDLLLPPPSERKAVTTEDDTMESIESKHVQSLQKALVTKDFLAQLSLKQQSLRNNAEAPQIYSQTSFRINRPQLSMDVPTSTGFLPALSPSSNRSSSAVVVVRNIFGTSAETVDGLTLATHDNTSMNQSSINDVALPREPNHTYAPSTSIVKVVALSKVLEYPGDVTFLRSLSLCKGSTSPTPSSSSTTTPPVLYDIDGKDSFGLSALHKALAWHQMDLVQFLVDARSRGNDLTNLEHVEADITSQIPVGNSDMGGFNVLHVCVDSGNHTGLRFFMSRSTKDVHDLLNLTDRHQRTPLQFAIERKDLIAIEILQSKSVSSESESL